LTGDEARQLPTVVDLPTAGRMLGIGRSAAYELVRTGQWPTPVLRLGRLIRVPTAPLLELLGERHRPVAWSGHFLGQGSCQVPRTGI
jgi:predicted DNA-binding transcriptional regulator AlpA